MENKELRVGFIGTGVISHHHMQGYAETPGVKVVAACDIDKPVLDAWCDKYGIPEDCRYTDYRKLLARDDIQAVDVCVHNNLHTPLSVAVMRAGKHCFCEKPMAATYADAKTMYEAWERYHKESGVELAVQMATIFQSQTRLAKKLVSQGDLGHVYFANVTGHRRRNRPGLESNLSTNFFKKEIAGRGALYDMGIYHIAQMLFILGLPKLDRVSGSMFSEIEPSLKLLKGNKFEVEELAMGFAKFSGGLTLNFMESWAIHMDTIGDTYIAGSKGGLKFTYDPPRPFGPPFPTPSLMFFTTKNGQDVDINMNCGANAFIEQGEEPETAFCNNNMVHWYGALTKQIDFRYPTHKIALATARLSEGIALSSELNREICDDEIDELSKPTAIRKQVTDWGTFEYDF
ncbi:MAG: Gfo/Idh/MocA family oxidoreductase [Clostridiales bacterium]|jgi:predicted dehydrogenase|nr:Gfo/Idh/MocA family oxidoreductase [Clostridiales bacterium]